MNWKRNDFFYEKWQWITSTTNHSLLTQKLHFKDRLQTSLLFLSEFKQINSLPFPMKSKEKVFL